MRWISTAQHAVDLAARRVSGRRAFGKPLADHQAVQFALADCAIDLHSSRLMALHAAWKIERGEPHRQEVSMLKTFAAEAFGRVMDRVVQLYGSHGLTTDEPIADWWAQARAARIADGPSEVHRMVIARELLRLARAGESMGAGCDTPPSSRTASSHA
ncbi:MAG: acyl-CoA dehydrogenase family protein [Solirubrobacteraceae bacterium]